MVSGLGIRSHFGPYPDLDLALQSGLDQDLAHMIFSSQKTEPFYLSNFFAAFKKKKISRDNKKKTLSLER